MIAESIKFHAEKSGRFIHLSYSGGERVGETKV